MTSTTLSLYNLPGDIYDTIAVFLPNNADLYRFLTLSRHISVSPYILQRRQWVQATLPVLARNGDLPGVQYLMQEHLSLSLSLSRLPVLARNGDLPGVQYLMQEHFSRSLSLSLLERQRALNLAALNSHLAVVQYLQRVGVPCNQTYRGHVAVAKFFQSFFKRSSLLKSKN